MITKSQQSPDAYLLSIARDILQKSDRAERARVQTAVTLRRRFRGTSKSDLFGLFHGVTGQWLGDDPGQQLFMDLYSVNITKNIISANQAAMVQARVECKVEPASKQKDLEGIAGVGLGIYKNFNSHPDYWSNNLENQGNQQIQTDYGIWLRSWFDPDADSPIKIKVDEYSDQPIEQPGRYACSCGAGGDLFAEMMGQASEDQVSCPKCGQMAEIVKMPEMGDVPMFHSSQEYPSGNIKLKLVSMFQIRIDERDTKSGNIRPARWLEHHFLMDEDELQALVPYFELQGAQEWSYPIKWEHCLETGTDLYLKSWGSDMVSDQQRPHEVRRIYLRPEFYRHYRSPSDFNLDRGDGQIAIHRDGSPMLSLKAGQGFLDQYPNGFWFMIDGDRLLPRISDPKIDTCDLRDEWAYFGFINDAASTYYQPVTELNELQRATNNLWTIDVQQRESASMNTTVYDRDWFDADDLEQQLAPTKEGKFIEGDGNINNHFAVIPGVVSTGAMEGIRMIQELKGDVVGVQPAMLGKVQPGVAYAAQALQREQSLGRLTPSQLSKAEAKALVTMQHLKLAQKHRPREWFEYIATVYGDEWKDQDIDQFLNSNLELDVKVSYKEDSVVPMTLIQRQLAFQQVLTTLGNAAKLTGDTRLLTPEIASKYTQTMGVDVDIENVDSDERLADSRYRKILKRLQQTDQSMPEPTIMQQVLASRDFTVHPRENPKVALEFWMDRYTALMADESPNYPLVLCVIQMIGRHEQAGVQQTQQDTSDQLEGQAPALAAAAAAQGAQGNAAAQSQQQAAQVKAQADAQLKQQEVQAKATLQAQDQQHKAELEAEKQRFQGQLQQAQLADREREREHVANQKSADVALEAARLAAEHPDNTEQHPLDKVSENLAYKDLAPPAKRDMLRHVGLSTEGVKDTQVNKPTPTKPKQPVRKPLA